MIEEVTVTCPACWESVSLLVDLSAGSQEYVEDCEVCCQPMRVEVAVAAAGDWSVTVAAEND